MPALRAPSEQYPTIEELCPPDSSISSEIVMRLWTTPILRQPPPGLNADYFLFHVRDKKRRAYAFLYFVRMAGVFVKENLVREEHTSVEAEEPKLYLKSYNSQHKFGLEQWIKPVAELWGLYRGEHRVPGQFRVLLRNATDILQHINAVYTDSEPIDHRAHAKRVDLALLKFCPFYEHTHTKTVRGFGVFPWLLEWYKDLEADACWRRYSMP